MTDNITAAIAALLAAIEEHERPAQDGKALLRELQALQRYLSSQAKAVVEGASEWRLGHNAAMEHAAKMVANMLASRPDQPATNASVLTHSAPNADPSSIGQDTGMSRVATASAGEAGSIPAGSHTSPSQPDPAAAPVWHPCVNCTGEMFGEAAAVKPAPDARDALDSALDLREAIATIEHDQWIAWSQTVAKQESISALRLDRWNDCWVPYADLSEEMKDHDRKWADKVLALMPDVASLKAENAALKAENEQLTGLLADTEAQVANMHDRWKAADGEVQTLRARLSIAEADRNAVGVRELEELAADCEAAAKSWSGTADAAMDRHEKDRLNTRARQLIGVAFDIRKKIAALSEKPAEPKPDAGLVVLRDFLHGGTLMQHELRDLTIEELCRRELARKGAK